MNTHSTKRTEIKQLFVPFVSPAVPLVPLAFFPLGKYFSNPIKKKLKSS